MLLLAQELQIRVLLLLLPFGKLVLQSCLPETCSKNFRWLVTTLLYPHVFIGLMLFCLLARQVCPDVSSLLLDADGAERQAADRQRGEDAVSLCCCCTQ